ncbi:hypothetical protein S7711_02947 [Stachybotrys chartarum IBT 7711]|uniref:1-alkyl-2-acetylglycerophosphocholine esterase n=1 Tax=Stachybotrys chartarum (strain CBS 109288 / IBT 7711) TaxID=1280523 RepID=A0A084B2E0_STACB|nr:hypothetical protein S7711_02947 [Stachybotrys chartarum IBT 7711]
MKLALLALAGIVLVAHETSAEPIPPPTGLYQVGMRRYAVPFTNPDDPLSPNNVSTEYLATLYYPTRECPGPPVPYLEPELARIFEDYWSYNISHLTMAVRSGAALLDEPVGPSLVFGPGGWGPPTDGFRILLTDLASHGYAVAALDHVYEQPFLRYPNGTGVYGLPLNFTYPPAFLNVFHEVRVREAVHFVSYWPSLVQAINAPFETHRIGAWGHSFGGSAALNAALRTPVIAAAANQDGSLFGQAPANLPSSDLRRPSMLLGQANHTPSSDAGFRNFTQQQTGWWRAMHVAGAVHQDWSDQTFWKIWGTTRPLGTIDGRRMVQIRSAFVRAFFDEHLKGEESPLLDVPAEDFPEVTVSHGSDL